MKMSMSRRDFLKVFGLGSAAAALTACGSQTAETATASSEAEETVDIGQQALAQTEEVSVTDKSTVDNTVHIDRWVVASLNPQTYDPINPNVSGGVILSELYCYLFEPFNTSEFDNPHPVMADQTRGQGGYDHESGSDTYTVYLYEGIHDAAGNPVDANDVKFCYDRFYEEGTSGGWKKDYYMSCEVVDSTTVEFKFTKEFYQPSMFKTYFAGVLIYSQKAYEESEDKFLGSSCGTNRYDIEELVPGVSVTLQRVADYWQTNEDYIDQLHQANVEHIEYQFISETSQQVMALQTGTIDMIGELNAQYLEDFLNNDDYIVNSYGDDLSYHVLPNMDPCSPLADINLRKAMFFAINPEDIAAGLGEGSVEPLKCIGNSNFAKYDDAWIDQLTDNYMVNPDIELAKEYLAKSSYDGSELRFVCSTDEITQNTAVLINTILEGIGIHSKITSLERSALTAVNADPTQWDFRMQMGASTTGTMGGTCFNDMDYTSSTKVTTTGEQANSCYLRDEHLQELIDTCMTIGTDTVENIQALDQYIIDNAYTTYLFRPIVNTVAKKQMLTVTRMYKNWVYVGACTYSPD